MPLISSRVLRERAEAGVEVCRTHGPLCKKYPDHPAAQERRRRDNELNKDLVEIAQAGHLLIWLKGLADASYEVPEEFTRGNEDPPRSDRVRLFFERYDLGKHFRSDEPYVEPPCKTGKLSDEEIRQRKEWAAEVKAARLKKGLPDPLPPWEKFDLKLANMLSGLGDEDDPEYRAFREFQERARREREEERAALVQRLKADEELAREMSEALATWVNLPPRNSRHTTDVREGYGDAVPEFEES
ncbi:MULTISPECIES: hypothetical protein [unclassified Streptomyces]|uniref:hypothetical protein n=1 Tax=unclassified Streptomyces TaxID=2593676 RepID=UPI0036E53093